MKNVRNTCRRLRCSQTSGRMSSVQWRKVVRTTLQFTARAYLFLKLQQSFGSTYGSRTNSSIFFFFFFLQYNHLVNYKKIFVTEVLLSWFVV